MKNLQFITLRARVLTFLTRGIKKELKMLHFTLIPPIRYYQTRPKNKEGINIIYVNFIKALLHNELNLDRHKFKTHAEILKFLQGFDKEISFSKSYISQLKTKGGQFKKVP
jgi:hypothetical protein